MRCQYMIYVSTTIQVFLSIKGIYFQAEVDGQTLTWITPYQFSQQVHQSQYTVFIVSFYKAL